MSEHKQEIQQVEKKEFVEPLVSEPVDVLETTAFFQVFVPGPPAPVDPGRI